LNGKIKKPLEKSREFPQNPELLRKMHHGLMGLNSLKFNKILKKV
jgi:hypothetical protein